ncbi:RagB/SusD family nutrient uptake outer membrane protein [Chitinophaga horti]|uniref:RagB/SusD family nutrient uptake outer membrane protein n=1 Tax=Chitinophaga horti TaxID=2920382 RepID=A0ABY6J9E1_9BACT|nr:RagB/SusD family nutrient uptake outer membrane protein [Chitinophaga horti]UYQ94919.1 RagB/SusD family nutrient uptake outer membrane protein [Chitinophaga horti]
MKKILLSAALLATLFSCRKAELELVNQNAYSYETYFATADALNQATIATYGTLVHQGLWARDYYFIFDLLGYEAKKTSNLLGDMAQLADYNFGPEQTQLAHLWQSLYRIVFRANIVDDRAAVYVAPNDADKNRVKQYLAEAKFLRAYAYFHLAMLWGDVPLYETYNEIITNNYIPRSPVADVWAFVEKDLKEAQADLPVAYATGELGRVTKGAATALLGKMYLYQKKWPLAQTEFLKLTAAPYTYVLEKDYGTNFIPMNQNSKENVFQIMNGPWTDWGVGSQYYMFGGQETSGMKATHSGRALEYGFNDWNNVYIPTASVRAFTYPNPVDGTPYTDPRAKHTFYGDAPSGGATVYCEQCPGGQLAFPFNTADPQGDYKWKKYGYYHQIKNYGAPISNINGQVIRYADVLLMLAETYIQQDETGAAPRGYIDSVRARVGAPLYTNLGDKTNAMNILMRERQLELCGEQVRYFDLIRWGIAKQTINAIRAAEPGDGRQPFEDKHVLFPIPNVEKNYNPNVLAGVKNEWN